VGKLLHTPDGHDELIRTVNNYYYQRDGQAWSYGNTYGEEARRYALKAWTTADDSRIERLIGETYGHGYFALDELQPYARTALKTEVAGVRVGANPCTG
jgi:hypothetical protein